VTNSQGVYGLLSFKSHRYRPHDPGSQTYAIQRSLVQYPRPCHGLNSTRLQRWQDIVEHLLGLGPIRFPHSRKGQIIGDGVNTACRVQAEQDHGAIQEGTIRQSGWSGSGAINLLTRTTKANVQERFEDMGGLPAFVEWAKPSNVQ
jgi:hypothetical protein